MNDEMEHRERTIQRLVQKGTYKSLLQAKCCECIYDDRSAGSWRKQVEECTSLDCPLFAKRPVTGGKNG